MQEEDIRKAVIDTYLKNDKDIDATMGNLSVYSEPLNQLTKKQVQDILVLAKVWESNMKTYRVEIAYLVQMEQVVEYIIEVENKNQLKDIDFLEENATEAVVIESSQVSNPYDPEIVFIEEIKNN